MTEEKTQAVLADFKIAGEVNLPALDVSEFVGKKTTIEKVEKFNGEHGPYVRISTPIIGKKGDKGEIEIRGSKILGLVKDEKGNIGWAANSKTAKFLKSMKVNTIDELLHKPVMLQQTEPNKDGKRFLTF